MQSAPDQRGTETAEVADARFRALLGEDAWARLPEPVRKRFSKRLKGNEVALYRGEVVLTKLSWAGRLLSFLTRVIGAPLPTANGATGAAVVAVTEDAALGGQRWVRLYDRPGRRAADDPVDEAVSRRDGP